MRGQPVKKIVNSIISFLPVVLPALIVVFMTAARFPNELEIIAEDGLYQHAGIIPDNIKIIAIDEATLEKLGPYSDWDRDYFSELIELLDSEPETKPAIIGMDIIFSGTNDSESDRRLAETVKKSGNVVLASKLETDMQVVRGEDGKYSVQPYISGEITAYNELNSVCESGFTNLILDNDGFVRRVYTKIDNADKTYKSFAYMIAEKAAVDSDALSALPKIVDIHYTGNPGDFETFSMWSVLSGEVPARYFKDSIVLVGAHEEGMLDSYKVPIDHSVEMYGVECHANAIHSFLNNRFIITPALRIELLIAAAVAVGFGLIMQKCSLLTGTLSMAGIVVGYPLAAYVLFSATSIRLSVIYIPLGVIAQFLAFVLIRYIELQKKRADEMQNMLFSMADSMAEAIEGRTPYNANHTKNVAKRCIEMLDYINIQHKAGRTGLHFSKKDKRQLYLAAMLHDIGKMDVPLEVMDKPTKLGQREAPLRSRLEIIKLRIMNDALNGVIPKEEANAQTSQIQSFLDQLGLYNCGRKLSDEEWAFIDKMCTSVYRSESGEEIPYITQEEADDLHIFAGTLSAAERHIMQSHVVYTDKILSHMHFGEDFCNVRAMAANHHELLNAKGYPNGIGADKLDVMTRILTIMDIFDSLIADDRPYKKAQPIERAFSILDEEAQAGKIDEELLKFAKEIWFIEENKGENV